MKQCNFCTATEDKTKIMFKGVLNAYICDKCIKACMKIFLKQFINNMDFKGPEK